MAISRLLIGSLLAAGTTLGGATIANAATDTAPPLPASAQSVPAQTEDGSVCKECTDVESLAKLTRADAEKIALEAHKGGKIVKATCGRRTMRPPCGSSSSRPPRARTCG
ncbi:hypothetical protein [Trueperella pecoris]|uniref:Uncharacterized protein n=1 Tax=Trueperella pecoris TaxID=2733571 RepID=A0A7M1QSX8_9ACTO|nr:hypothetical protein [Trueperella pecoris]QOR44963.1 hypothetical protein INS88_06620 [Trueperella pecoris]QTG74872.1 hypothetical protein J4179_06465 [Trueperella pecoris]